MSTRKSLQPFRQLHTDVSHSPLYPMPHPPTPFRLCINPFYDAISTQSFVDPLNIIIATFIKICPAGYCLVGVLQKRWRFYFYAKRRFGKKQIWFKPSSAMMKIKWQFWKALVDCGFLMFYNILLVSPLQWIPSIRNEWWPFDLFTNG